MALRATIPSVINAIPYPGNTHVTALVVGIGSTVAVTSLVPVLEFTCILERTPLKALIFSQSSHSNLLIKPACLDDS
jgi:hypothetical protein